MEIQKNNPKDSKRAEEKKPNKIGGKGLNPSIRPQNIRKDRKPNPTLNAKTQIKNKRTEKDMQCKY